MKQIEELFQVLSFHAGVKYKELKTEEQRQRQAEDILKEAEKEYYEQRRKQPGAEQRSLDYISRRMRKARKLGAF